MEEKVDNDEAMHVMGTMYKNGQGVQQSLNLPLTVFIEQ